MVERSVTLSNDGTISDETEVLSVPPGLDRARRETMRVACSKLIFWSALLLLLLSGCASAPTQPSPTHVGTVPTPTFSTTPTATPLPFLPHDHDPFQATFIEYPSSLYTYPVSCPHSPRPTDVCWHVAGEGTSIPYGPVTFTSFDINFLLTGKPPIDGNPHPGYCEPTTRQASVTIRTDMVRFTASGTWCVNLVHFAYQVTRGTGSFQHAHGTGSITIDQTTYPQPILEYWTGTLTP